MTPIVHALRAFAASFFRSRVSLQLEIVALRHQLTFYQRSYGTSYVGNYCNLRHTPAHHAAVRSPRVAAATV
jgi:hypothetical protein